MSSLKKTYESFLASPNGSALNDDASLNYITTLTTIKPAAAVLKHFAAHEKVLKKKGEKALDAIESDNALYLEVETTLEFLSSGGVRNFQEFHSPPSLFGCAAEHGAGRRCGLTSSCVS